jgi:hypothetical protein
LARLQFPSLGFQPCGQPRALFPDDGDPRLHLARRVQRSDGGLLGQSRHRERNGGPAQPLRDVRRGHGVPHPQAGESVGFREGAKDADVRVLAVESQGVGAAAGLGVFHVGFVDHHEDVGADGAEERLHALVTDRDAGRVVGRAEQDHLGPFGDRGGHGVEVVALGVVQGDADRPGTCQLHQDGVGLEGPPREDHFIPGVADPGDDLLKDADAAGSHRDFPGADAELPGDPFAELDGAHVRIAVHPAGRFGHRSGGRGQGFVVAFVAGEGRDVRAGAAPARDVGRESGYRRTQDGVRGVGSRQDLICGHEA